jgi:hypothetical protein
VKRVVLALLLAGAAPAGAQTLDPRSFVNTPVGINFAVLGLGYQSGNVLFDASVPITDAQLTIWSPTVGYARALDLWGLSGKADAALGYACADGRADLSGQAVNRNVCGLTDPTAHVSVNFIGAPALTMREYPTYRQNWLVGAGIRVTAPLGQYDPTKLVNIGTNRWAFRTELGVSKVIKRLTLEILGAGTFYTTNTDFLNGQSQSQSPLWSAQFNAIYTFRSGIWGGVGIVQYGGGKTSIDDGAPSAMQQNGRAGAVLVLPVGKKNSFKASYSSGVWTRTGTDFDFLAVSWVYLWGGKH